ncbi:hypothetical protein [Streptomyces sp. NPDC048111]|uniref:hypothetical protein n=1 Tax=Streptomyces sp. NPDC048111 TaxID=3365500 RepID=UPI00371FE132
MGRRGTGVWAVGAVAVVVAVTGCSAGSHAVDTGRKAADKAAGAADKANSMVLAALTRAGDRSQKAGSAEVSVTTQLANQPAPTTMAGTYTWGNGLAFDVEADAKSMNMQQLVSDGTVTMRYVKGAYYYGVDAQPSGPLENKHWMKVEASAILGEQGESAVAGSGDPTAGLRSLRYAKNVAQIGQETVLGRSTTHYKAVVSKADLGAAGKALSGDDGNSLMKQFTGGVDQLTFEVWVDKNDLPVRVNEQFGGATVSMDFKRFGATKPVVVPTASDTADMTEAFKKLTQPAA